METNNIQIPQIYIGNEGPFYRYDIKDLKNVNFIDLPNQMGLFLFSKRELQMNGSYNHEVCYVGESNDLSNLSLPKEIQDKIFAMCVNSISIKLFSSSEEMSKAKSKYLDFWHPQLN